MSESKISYVARRGELLAELFLQDLMPQSLTRQAQADFGFDYFISFSNRRGGLNTFAVEVKATQKELGSFFSMNAKVFDRMIASNIPVFLLVVDVKNNKFAYAWPQEERDASKLSQTVRLKISLISKTSRRTLIKRFRDFDAVLFRSKAAVFNAVV